MKLVELATGPIRRVQNFSANALMLYIVCTQAVRQARTPQQERSRKQKENNAASNSSYTHYGLGRSTSACSVRADISL
ncbi:hypothetical protein BaRGS_00018343 [Batillaria attramentaria]|uniref:Uncharacterized protein n=1 Tax=Batillaria attramentaria TaxID=370345 RepID=A0ABD0KT61_9CAEN